MQKGPVRMFFYIIGIAMIVGGVLTAARVEIAKSQTERVKSGFQTVQGVVQKINYKNGNSNDKEVLVRFTVDDIEYEDVRVYDYPVDVREGVGITVYYDPANPKSTIPYSHQKDPDDHSILIGIFLMISGVVLICIGINNKHSLADDQLQSRFTSYEEYSGETTERAGTLFDREVDPAELKLEKASAYRRRRFSRNVDRRKEFDKAVSDFFVDKFSR